MVDHSNTEKLSESEALANEDIIDNTGLCGEAQADGVPCEDPTKNCEECDQAPEIA
ncbi:hypothetical protein KAI87_03150 [Myxococcota bacterium]|nr:hypothetical protein [Myxococcota bacterium]